MKYFFLLLFYPVILCAQSTWGKTELARNTFVHWSTSVFKEKEHTIGICKTDDFDYICTIDGKAWYGGDIGMDKPRNQLVNLELELNGKRIPLETTNMFNPSFDGSLGADQFKLQQEGSHYRLYAFFSDGAGTYMAEWKIVNGTSVRELISNDEKYFGWQD